MDTARDWLSAFDERQQKEIEFASLYMRDFSHGTNGHNDLLIIAKMASLLDAYNREFGWFKAGELDEQ